MTQDPQDKISFTGEWFPLPEMAQVRELVSDANETDHEIEAKRRRVSEESQALVSHDTGASFEHLSSLLQHALNAQLTGVSDNVNSLSEGVMTLATNQRTNQNEVISELVAFQSDLESMRKRIERMETSRSGS